MTDANQFIARIYTAVHSDPAIEYKLVKRLPRTEQGE